MPPFILAGMLCLLVLSAPVTAGMWQAAPAAAASLRPDFAPGDTLELDITTLGTRLLAASEQQSVTLSLPLPGGKSRAFEVFESPIMAPELARQHPDMRTYKAYAVEGSGSGRLDFGPNGFHAYLRLPGQVVLIDPLDAAAGVYRVYRHRGHKAGAAASHKAACLLDEEHRLHNVFHRPAAAKLATTRDLSRSSGALKTYRLAIAATREYSNNYGGGTRSGTQVDIITAINRVNQVYEVELGISLQLVNNTDIIYLTEPDPYTDSNLSLLLDENQSNLDAELGAGNYDVGHVLSSDFGGLASLGVVCDNNAKGRGATGRSNRNGDDFYIDLLAHEIGHQFGADHSYNGTSASCGGARNRDTTYEPGSGITIMAYAGLCGPENIAGSSIATFHAGSIEQITTYTDSGIGASCAGSGPNGSNRAPDADAGSNYTIPGDTPFMLSGSASDPDPSPSLSYKWEQINTRGRPTTDCSYGSDLGDNPLFRSWLPDSSPVRVLPALGTLLTNNDDPAEKLPTESRDLDFRFTVLDGNGGVDEDDMVVTVDANSGPFRVIQPNSLIILDSTLDQAIEWHTACSEQAPVNCSTVDIAYSIDNGNNWVNLLTATPNDGEAVVNFAGINASGVRLRISCSNNIFFDISDRGFSLNNGVGSQLLISGNGGIGSCGTSTPSSCSSGVGGNDIEPNDSVATAQAVTLPVQVSGGIHDSLDPVDTFSFVAAAGSHTLVLNSFGQTNDLDLYLLDSDGSSQLAASESGFDDTEQFSLDLQEGRTYYVEVIAFDTLNSETTYVLTVSRDTAGFGSGAGFLHLLMPLASLMILLAGRSRPCTRA